MPDDGSEKNSENRGGGSLVERAMRGARRVSGLQSSVGTPSPDAKPDQAADRMIERAVEGKIVPREPKSGLEDYSPASPVTQTPPSAPLEQPVPATVPADEQEPPAAAPATVVETSPVPPGCMVAAADSEDPSATATGSLRSRSRIVDLDFDRLETKGFITPNRVRTRTTEEFRLIKRSILQGVSAARAEGRRNPNLVMVTSATPSEGKTFNAINLAISISMEPDFNTLLVDADLVKPSIFAALGIEPGRGLVDLIESGDFNLGDVLVRTNIEGMSLLSAGTQNAMATELIASERMRRFADEVAQRYNDRIVIFDAPPILATSEASVLTEHMSQIVFVIEADRTSRTMAKEALDMIGPGPRVGLVLNKASARFGALQFGAYYKPYSRD
jgi:protein-tyrosine kinase